MKRLEKKRVRRYSFQTRDSQNYDLDIISCIQ